MEEIRFRQNGMSTSRLHHLCRSSDSRLDFLKRNHIQQNRTYDLSDTDRTSTSHDLAIWHCDAVVRDPADGRDVDDLVYRTARARQPAGDIRVRRFAIFIAAALKCHPQRVQSPQDETRTPTERPRRAFQSQPVRSFEQCVDGDLRL